MTDSPRILYSTISRARPSKPDHRGGQRTGCLLLSAERTGPLTGRPHAALLKELLEEKRRRRGDEPARLPVRQNDHTGSGRWGEHERRPEAGISAIVIHKLHAAILSGKPAERIMQTLNVGRAQPAPTAISGRCNSASIWAEATRRPDTVPLPS